MESPLGAQTVLGDRHDPVYEFFLQVPSVACGTRPRELSTAGDASVSATDTAAESATDTAETINAAPATFTDETRGFAGAIEHSLGSEKTPLGTHTDVRRIGNIAKREFDSPKSARTMFESTSLASDHHFYARNSIFQNMMDSTCNRMLCNRQSLC